MDSYSHSKSLSFSIYKCIFLHACICLQYQNVQLTKQVECPKATPKDPHLVVSFCTQTQKIKILEDTTTQHYLQHS